MTAVLLVGAGAVGRRAARQLAETDGVERILIADRAAGEADDAARAMGERAEAVDWTPDRALPAGVTVVASAVGGAAERAVFERAVEAGVPAAGCGDDSGTVRSLLDLDDAAREAGVSLAAGCGLAPGLSDVLARHAADAVETVGEIHVARAGSAGPACRSAIDRSSKGPVLEWRDGAWTRHRAGSGRQLVWFPSPVGGLDCHRSGSGQAALLVDAFPTLSRATMRIAAPAGAGRRLPGLRLLDQIPVVSALAAGGSPRRRAPHGARGGGWGGGPRGALPGGATPTATGGRCGSRSGAGGVARRRSSSTARSTGWPSPPEPSSVWPRCGWPASAPAPSPSRAPTAWPPWWSPCRFWASWPAGASRRRSSRAPRPDLGALPG